MRWNEFFRGHAPEYDTNEFVQNTQAEVDFLMEHLAVRPGCSVLDIGCGTGRHSIELAKRGCTVTGVDLTPEMLDIARHKASEAGLGVEWVCADATTFRPSRTYDHVICLCEGAFGLLGTGDDAIGQPLAILRTIARSLRDGGNCMATVLNAARMIRLHGPSDQNSGLFDLLTLTERSECNVEDKDTVGDLRERGFVPPELVLLFSLAGLHVTHLGGGTAGNWGVRTPELDEFELMVIATKSADEAAARLTYHPEKPSGV